MLTFAPRADHGGAPGRQPVLRVAAQLRVGSAAVAVHHAAARAAARQRPQ